MAPTTAIFDNGGITVYFPQTKWSFRYQEVVIMDSIVAPFKAYMKKSDPAVIDNIAFKLHYRATFVVLLVSIMLVGIWKILSQLENIFLIC
jgi:hypothetical protein